MTLCSLKAEIVSSQDYQYPFVNNLLGTMGATIIKTPPRHNFEVLKLQVRARRAGTPIGLEKVRVHYYSSRRQSEKVIFVMAGLGGDGKGNLGNFLANFLSQQGYHAFVIPSLFFKRFAYAASSHGLPGNIAEDVKDYYQGMQKIIQMLSQRLHISFRDVNLMGYSLGGITALHLAHEDSIQRVLNFRKVIALNPPVDLKYGIELLDSFYYRSERMGRVEKAQVLVRALKQIKINSSAQLNVQRVSNFFNQFGSRVSNAGLEFLISTSMRRSLTGIVLASQKANNTGVLPLIFKRRAAKKFTFSQYIQDILVPFYSRRYNMRNLSFSDISNMVSVPIISGYLRSAQNVFLMHNADDFLLRPGDVQYIDSLFGHRSVIYPRGGHLGNLWHPRNLRQITNWLMN